MTAVGTLRLRVDQSLGFMGGPPPRVFARIIRIDEKGHSRPEFELNELIPISKDPAVSGEIRLSPGYYAVEVTLPSGEWLSDAVRVADQETRELVLVAASSPGDWLGWRDLNGGPNSAQLVSRTSLGSAREGPVLSTSLPRRPRSSRFSESSSYEALSAPQSPSRVRLSKGPLERAGLRVIDGRVTSLSDESVAGWDPQIPVNISVDRSLYWLHGGPAGAEIDVLRTDPWGALPAMSGPTEGIVNVLNAGRRRMYVEPVIVEKDYAVFPVPNDFGRVGHGFSQVQRTFVALHRRQGVELVCLPTPWVAQMGYPEVAVEVIVQRPRFEREFAGTISVRDHKLAVLLGFLSSGALPAAKRIAETAGEMLYEKNSNPLAAAAGGYALVSGVVNAKPSSWHHWIENLMDRFEQVPDGAIQYGTMRMRMSTGESDFREAARAFKLAYHRGVPFYGMGMRWLLEGLQRVGVHDNEAKCMSERVQRLTARMHPQCAFTTLRLGKL